MKLTQEEIEISNRLIPSKETELVTLQLILHREKHRPRWPHR